MRIKQKNPFLKYAFYSSAANIILTPIVHELAVIFGYLAIICFLIYPLMNGRAPRKFSMIFVLLVLTVFVSCLLSMEYFDRSQLRAYIISIMSFLAFYYSIADDKETASVTFGEIYRTSLILAVCFTAYTIIPLPFAYQTFGEYGNKLFTMGLGNPNAVSIYVLFVIMVILLQLTVEKNKLKKGLLSALILSMLYTLYLLSSRAVVLCAVAALFFFFQRKRRSFGRWFAYLSFLIPFIAIPVLMINSKKLIAFKIFGKALNTGRDAVYGAFFDGLSSGHGEIVFGQLFKYPFLNLHNGPLSIFAATGIVGLIIWMVIWLRFIKRFGKSDNTAQNMSYVFSGVFLLHSFAEAMSVIGTIPYSIFVLLIVKIAQGNIPIDASRKHE